MYEDGLGGTEKMDLQKPGVPAFWQNAVLKPSLTTSAQTFV